jgi:hypothetical protein
VSVDTNIKGKNLAPYKPVRHDDLTVLVAPSLSGLASYLRVSTRGGWRKKFVIDLQT